MGKYMKKSKIAGDVAAVIMEAPSHTTTVGVRTRAKTLALQKSPIASPQHMDSSSYLELRSRRLRKLPPPPQPRRENASAGNSRLRECSGKTSSSVEKLGSFCAEEENVDFTVEGSFGENFLEIEGKDRSTRESTPCSLIRDSSVIHTPGSTTRQRTQRVIHENMQRNIPTSTEMDEFFALAEKQQQANFMEKYNFDVVNDVPLPGRYEWVPVLN
ncbi:cyclin-dependent kinase inhibitor 3-like protein [Trifolium pratense]|uniref:Cyclin-dependent kinase inhibitor n=1 Tax=Trifolium pratense TaxID=57577 RepID=A0A2K3MP96_TRIPR|nr:cyclin-dependent kinase inhibitor 3-like protein [Trifolium pratense]